MWFGSNVYEERYCKTSVPGALANALRPTLDSWMRAYQVNVIWIRPASTLLSDCCASFKQKSQCSQFLTVHTFVLVQGILIFQNHYYSEVHAMYAGFSSKGPCCEICSALYTENPFLDFTCSQQLSTTLGKIYPFPFFSCNRCLTVTLLNFWCQYSRCLAGR